MIKNTQIKYFATPEIIQKYIAYGVENPWGSFSRTVWPNADPDSTRKAETYILKQIILGNTNPVSSKEVTKDSGNTKVIDRVVYRNIKTIEDVEKELNLDKTEWYIFDWSCTLWPTVVKEKKGEDKLGVVFELQSLHAVVKRNNPVIQAKQIIEELIELAKLKMPVKPPQIEPLSNTVIGFCAFDVHMGKLAWGKECGEDYDLEIATKLFLQGVEVAAHEAKHYNASRIFLPLGNDLIHVDGKNNMTFAGTPQDVDTRFQKIYKETRKMCVLAIERLSQIAPVDIIIVPGNHDATVMFTLGDALELFYSNNQRVTVDNSPKDRKYYQFGQNLIMLTHGSEETGKIRLGELMAAEMPKEWGSTKFHEALIGHLHHENVRETLGFRTRIVSSISAPDAYHVGKGYVSNIRRSEIFIYDKEKGLVGQRFANV